MKLIAILILFVSLPLQANSKWSQADLNRQGLYTVLHVTDWAQTLDIANSGGKELNPILGEYPSVSSVNQYFIATLSAHYFIADLLKPRDRKLFQLGTIALQAVAVIHNHSIGFEVRF